MKKQRVGVCARGAALSLPRETTSFSHFCRETCLSSYFALSQGLGSITSLWRVEEAGPSYSLPSRAEASSLAGLAWLWLETNGQGGGVNETLKDEVDVVCPSSESSEGNPEHSLKSPGHFWCLPPHPPRRLLPTGSQTTTLNPDPSDSLVRVPAGVKPFLKLWCWGLFVS